jgi:DNA-binding MarR family transcriptional regulator
MPRTATRIKAADEIAPQLNLGGLDALVGFQLRCAMIAVYRNFTQHLAPLDLTQKQAAILWLIGANAGVSQIVLANAVLMDRASMMAIIDRLEERGLIIRKRSARDGRKQELYLTPKGTKVMAQSKAAVASHEEWLKGRFSEAELAAFVDALVRISVECRK